jgi:regulator of replication initiation timing
MISNDLVFARLNKITAAQTNLSEEVRKVELALVDDALQLAQKLFNYVTEETALSQKFDRILQLKEQFESEANVLYQEYESLKNATEQAYSEAESLTSELENAANALGIEPSELSAYDELVSAMTSVEEVADNVSTYMEDDLFTFLG